MRALLAPTDDYIKRERGTLRSDVAAGSDVSVPVQSAEGLSANDFICIGYEGNELAELCRITSVSTSSVTVATLKFNHVSGEPFVAYRFDKRKFYGAATATGSYTELTTDGSPKDISVDDPLGTLLEYSGSVYEYFKSTYYNSITAEETALEDSDAVPGDQSSRYATVYAIRKHAGLAGNPNYSDLRVETKRKQAENEIDSAIVRRYALPLAEVPALLSQICELLAAGYIDYEEFGGEGEGVKWLGEARALLKQIEDGKRLLLDTTGQELTRQTTISSGAPSGYPNSADTDAAQFAMDDRF